MNPGVLKDEITIQQPTTTVQANGQSVTTWSTYATRLAKVTTPSVKQFMSASKELKQGGNPRTMRQNKWLVMIRHDADLSSDMQVRWLDHTLSIEGITADPQNAVYMFLHCYETVPASQGFGELAAAPSMIVRLATGAQTVYDTGDTVDMGTISTGASSLYSFAIVNDDDATAPLTVAVPIAVAGDTDVFAFYGSQPDAVIMPDSNDTFSISAESSEGLADGTYTASVTLETNDPDNPSFVLNFTVDKY